MGSLEASNYVQLKHLYLEYNVDLTVETSIFMTFLNIALRGITFPSKIII